MSNAVAKVSFLQGQAWAKTADGNWRALTVGSTLNDDEILVTAKGARVELDTGNGDPLVINGGLTVGMSRDLLAQTATETDEALLSDASVQEALTVLEQGGDLLEELEETAAGNTGGGSSEGHSFVQLTRLIETTDSQSFDFASANPLDRAAGISDGEYTNRTPLVTDQVIASSEDESVTGQVIAEDTEGDAITFTLTTPPANGVVTLDPVTGQFTFTPNANYNGSDSFVVTVTDSHGNSADTIINLNIAPVNDAPTTAGLSLTTDEDAPVSGQVIAEDIEGDSLSYTVSGQPANGTVVLDPVTGTFVYTPNANYNGSDSFVVTISDGNGGTTTSTITVGVTPVNDLPVSGDQNLTTLEDTPIAGQITATDVDGDTLGYTVSGQPANGTVVLNVATGSFTYTPNANYNGSDSFVVTISDGKGGTTTSTITIGVAPVNDVPVSSNLNLATPEDTPVSGQVSTSDLEGDNLGFSVSGNPANGSVVINATTGSFTYTPNANYNGSDSFVVTISDGKGGSTTSTITIGVTPVNDLPVSSNQNLSTPEDTPINGQVTATDVDGDTRAYTVSGQPANGTVVLNVATGSFTYTPNANYNGSDSFVVTISDGKGGTTTSTITIGVTPANDAPVANNLNLETSEDTPVSGQVSASDPEGDSLSFSVSGKPTNGTVVLDPATGTFVYSPNANYNGSDSFVVTISDGKGGTTTSTVNIGVSPVNDGPVALDDTATTNEDTAVVIGVRGNDTDADGDSLTVTGVTQGANGSVVIDALTGNPIYTPNAGFSGSDTFTYTVDDDHGGTATATVTVTVNAVNHAPVTVAETITVAEGGTVTTLNGEATSLLANDTDADLDSLVAVLVTGPTHGTLVLNPNGTFSYVHDGSETTNDSFTYKTNDGTVDGNEVTVNIKVTPVNDAPVGVADHIDVAEGGTATILASGAISLLANDSDAESNTLSAILVSNPSHGTLTLNANGTFSYTHDGSETTSDSFTYRANDGTANGNLVTVTIAVTAKNDAPIALDDTATTDENTAVTIAVRGNDTDAEGDSLAVTEVTQGANGSVVIDAVTGNPVYTPNAGFSGSDTFTYTVDDDHGGTATATVTVTVNMVNVAPVTVADAITVAEGGTATTLNGGATNLLANDTDADLDPLVAVLVTGPTHGSLVLNPNGTFSYVHDGSETTVDSFTYKTNDGTVDGNEVTVNITVTPVNDAPVGVADHIDVAEGGTATILASGANNLLANDSDAESNTLSAVLVSNPSHGTLTLNANGTFSYTHDGSETTSDSFTYRANDGTTNGNLVTVTIAVTPVNDAPQTNAVTVTGDEDTLVTINLAGTDVDGTVTGFVIKSLPANGVLYSDNLMTSAIAVGDVVSGPVYFKPTTNWNGSTSLTYAANDNLNLEDATPATVSITINPVADAAVLGSGSGTVKEDTPAQTSASGVLSIVDPDAGQAAFQAQTNTPGTYGSFSITAGGNWIYTIDNSKPVVQALKEGETKTETFTVSSIDGTTSSVVITVVGTNEAPVANADTAMSTAASNIGLVSEYFGYSDTLNGPNLSSVEQVYSFINGRTADATFIAKTFDYGASSTFSNNLGNGTNLQSFLGSDATSLSTDPATTSDAIIRMRGFVELGAGTYNFKVTADDGFQIRVDGVVVAQVNQNQSSNTTTHASFTLATGGLHTVEVVYWDQGAYARLKLELSDDAGTSYKLLSSVPSYQNTIFSAVEDTALSIPASSLLANDTDANGDTLSIQSVQGAVNGTVSLVAGSVVFTPAANYNGPASFTYTISDGNGGTATATVNLSVAPVNDAPVAVSNSATVAPNATLNIPVTTLLANDTDVDGDKLSIVSVQNPVNGSVSISGNNVVFVPTSNYEGPASFTYTARDPMGATSTATVNVSVGAATAPSLVVMKTLLAVAHGTAGISVKFPIVTALVDTDGSETLTVKISNVPTSATFNAGTNLGLGVWLIQESDLPNLTLNLPGGFSQSGSSMTVQVISTEANGGGTASVSNTVMLHATYTTVDKTTTTSGNLTGTNANEYITGGDGDNVITGGNGNDVINGGAGNDTLSASSGSDMFYGGTGNDLITGSTGIDRISGGADNDTMSGGVDTSVDVFAWTLGDQGNAGAPAVDTINNFVTSQAGSNHTGGDVLDLRDLLVGEHVGANNAAGNLADYLHFEVAGGTTTIHISHTGGFAADSHSVSAAYTSSAETQKIVLNNVDLQSVYSGATTDQQIITQLLNNNKLITD